MTKAEEALLASAVAYTVARQKLDATDYLDNTAHKAALRAWWSTEYALAAAAKAYGRAQLRKKIQP